jgi:hypothetical protein
MGPSLNIFQNKLLGKNHCLPQPTSSVQKVVPGSLFISSSCKNGKQISLNPEIGSRLSISGFRRGGRSLSPGPGRLISGAVYLLMLLANTSRGESRITAESGSRPDQSLIAMAPWFRNMGRPRSATQPRAATSVTKGVHCVLRIVSQTIVAGSLGPISIGTRAGASESISVSFARASRSLPAGTRHFPSQTILILVRPCFH